MKSIVGAGGITIFVNGKEWDLIDAKSESFLRSTLDDNEKYTASQMHRKGILSAKKINNDVRYTLSGNRK